MATLIYASNSQGCIGRCDSRCYNAEGPDCECICGGINHGVGKIQAISNTQKYADEWIDDYKKKHKEEIKCEVNHKVVSQLSLF